MAPSQHQPPAAPLRAPALVATEDDPLHQPSPLARDEELWWVAECPDDPQGLELRADPDSEPRQRDDRGRVAELLAAGDTRWSLDLDDPYAWQDAGPFTAG